MEQSSQGAYYFLLPILADDHGVSFGPSFIQRSIMQDLLFDDGDCCSTSGDLGLAGDVIPPLGSRLVLSLTQSPMCRRSSSFLLGFILGCNVKSLKKSVDEAGTTHHAHTTYDLCSKVQTIGGSTISGRSNGEEEEIWGLNGTGKRPDTGCLYIIQ